MPAIYIIYICVLLYDITCPTDEQACKSIIAIGLQNIQISRCLVAMTIVSKENEKIV